MAGLLPMLFADNGKPSCGFPELSLFPNRPIGWQWNQRMQLSREMPKFVFEADKK
jgi:hypothetical protein